MKYEKIGLCNILKKIFNNAYQLELPERFYISPMLNIADLYEFHKGKKGEDEGTVDDWMHHLPVKANEEIEEILATRVGKKTCQKEYLEYLVKWKNRGSKYASWIFIEKIVHMKSTLTLR